MRRRAAIALLVVFWLTARSAEAYPIVWTFHGTFAEPLDEDFSEFGIGFDAGDPVDILAEIDSAAPNLCGNGTGNGAYPLSSISVNLNGIASTQTIVPGIPLSAPGFIEVNAAFGCGIHFGGLVFRLITPFQPFPPGYSLILVWYPFPGSTLQDAVDLAIPFGPPFASLRSGTGDVAQIAIEDMSIQSLPEPSTLLLAGTGLAVLARRVRCRRSSRHARPRE